MKPMTCACPGPLCGQQTYAQMLAAMKQHYRGNQFSEHELEQMHRKWKRLAAEVR
jgi:hypothetical protein